MRKTVTLAIVPPLVMLCLIGSAPARGAVPYPQSVRNALTERYTQLMMAWARHESAALAPLLKPFYLQNGFCGKRVKDEEATLLAQEDVARLNSVKVRALSVKSLKITGNKAVTTVESSLAVTVPTDKVKPHRRVVNLRFRDTWSRSGAKWTLLERKPLSGSTTLDGKPLHSFNLTSAEPVSAFRLT